MTTDLFNNLLIKDSNLFEHPLDCFAALAMTGDGAYQSCTATASAVNLRYLHRHCERSEAIHEALEWVGKPY
jgi:uncharacterized protein YvpB